MTNYSNFTGYFDVGMYSQQVTETESVMYNSVYVA